MDPTTALAGLDAHPWAAVPYLARIAAAWAVGRTREGGAVRAQLLDLAGVHEAAVTHCRAAAEQTTSRSEREHPLRQAHRTS
ncbi:hypothetical protein [Kitasatospora sp. NPDC056800]|uniref:hypothetical protein n=1 Tax=Kitasatospora sp. NPDC056800 TaxID=3345948 RepID=UPI00368E54E9